jgi:hypothetical protein
MASYGVLSILPHFGGHLFSSLTLRAAPAARVAPRDPAHMGHACLTYVGEHAVTRCTRLDKEFITAVPVLLARARWPSGQGGYANLLA